MLVGQHDGGSQGVSGAAAQFDFLVAASLGALLPFTAFFLIALVRRKNRALHGRLMLLAWVSIAGIVAIFGTTALLNLLKVGSILTAWSGTG